EYRYRASAKGVTNDGILASFGSYESSDGVTVFTRSEYFRSNSDMKIYFEKVAKHLAEMIEVSKDHTSKDHTKEERVVGKHPPNDKGMELYSIMRSENRTIRYIESTSLVHILDFEKQNYKSEK